MEFMKVVELAISGLVTLGAAYLGARFAFQFNIRQQETARRDAHVEECNRAMLGLFRQFNTLATYRKQMLEPHRASQGRHLEVSASLPRDPAADTINAAALAFLLATDARDTVGDMALLDEKYRACIELINQHSGVHTDQYQPRIEEASKGHEDLTKVRGELVEAWAGPRIVGTLRRATDDLYEMLDSTIAAFAEAGAQLPLRLKQALPRAKIIAFGPIDATQSSLR